MLYMNSCFTNPQFRKILLDLVNDPDYSGEDDYIGTEMLTDDTSTEE